MNLPEGGEGLEVRCMAWSENVTLQFSVGMELIQTDTRPSPTGTSLARQPSSP